MSKRAKRKADVAPKFPVRREVRKPVDSLRLHQVLHAPALRGHPGQLCVAEAAGVLLGVEIQPLTVGRVFRTIEMAAASIRIAGLASGRRDQGEPTGNGELPARQFDESQRRTIRGDTMQKVVATWIMRHARSRAAL